MKNEEKTTHTQKKGKKERSSINTMILFTNAEYILVHIRRLNTEKENTEILNLIDSNFSDRKQGTVVVIMVKYNEKPLDSRSNQTETHSCVMYKQTTNGN